MVTSLLDPAEVETERGVIVSSSPTPPTTPSTWPTRPSRAPPSGRALAGPPHRGTPATVTAVPRDAVWDHYRRTYAADTLVVAAAGAVNHEEICRR